MNGTDARRLRRAFDQAETDEQTYAEAIQDDERELAACDDPKGAKATMLRRNLEGLRAKLAEARAKADELRVRVREAGLPPVRPPHPKGGAAELIERVKRVGPGLNEGSTIEGLRREWDPTPAAPAKPRHKAFWETFQPRREP